MSIIYLNEYLSAPLELCTVIAGCTDAGCPLVQDNIQRLAVTLYTELLSRLVSLINRYSAVQYSIVQYSTSPGASSPTTNTLLQSYSSTLPASRTPTLLVRRRTVMQYLLTTTCIVSSQESSLQPALSICATIICKNVSRNCS